jgi:hypothetical protein
VVKQRLEVLKAERVTENMAKVGSNGGCALASSKDFYGKHQYIPLNIY